MRRESAKAGARPAVEKEPPRACSDARRGRAVGAAKVQAECRRVRYRLRGARSRMPLTLPKLYLRTENAVLCRPSAERGRMLEGSGFGMVLRAADALQSRKASLIAAFADTCGGAHKGGAGQRRSFGGKPCLRFGAVRFLQGRGTFDFCGGGAFDFLPPSADGSEGLPRRVRRRWLLAAQRRGWCGALLLLLLLLLLCSPDACGAGLRQCGGGGGDGQRLLVIRRSERRFLQRLCLFYYAS